MKKLRVLLVDDHEVVRLGLIALLEDIEWVEVVGEAGTAEEAVQAVLQTGPDVIVMDIRLPGDSGITACRSITQKWPNIHVIMLTTSGNDEVIFDALQAGASGYILKEVGNQALISALEAARLGDSMLDPVVTGRVIARLRESGKQSQENVFLDLTDREKEVLALLTHGKSNSDIARELSLSQKTVGHHVGAILSKLGLSNRIEAATFAIKHHLSDYLKNR